MKTLDFSLDADKNGGKITAFSYSHSLNELVGSWSARAVGGTFKAGKSITFSGVMSDGIITSAYKDSEGLWYVEGKDAGVKLMKSTPDISDLPEGNTKNVMRAIADFCGITLIWSMAQNGIDDFNVRSVITGSTCAEAVLELALVSGFIVYIDNLGRLNVKLPVNSAPNFNNTDIIDDSGSDIDLDGYATQVLVNLNRRKWDDPNDNVDDDSGEVITTGETPSTNPSEETVSGTFSNGTYSITTLEPFGVVSEVRTSITDNGVQVTTVETHEYEHKHKIIWRDNQEYVLFAFIEKKYELERTAEGQYNGVLYSTSASGTNIISINPKFKEVTTETLTRTFSGSDAVIGIPEDWQGNLKLVSKETITRSTVRTGDVAPSENMPPYSPPFDSQITRTYKQEKNGTRLLCDEVELTYEARQVGSVAPVKSNGTNIPHFLQGSNLAIQTHSTPQWVLVKKKCSYFEQYDNDGQCLISARSEYSDDGAEWLVDNALTDTGNSDMNAYQAAYAAFSQNSKGLQVSTGSSISRASWQFVELPGRTKSSVTQSDIDKALGNVSDWYDNGQYVRQSVCPHYNSSTKSCNVYMLDNPSSQSCNHYNGTRLWLTCTRALAALARARENDTSQVEVPIIGTASISGGSSKSPNVGYQKDIYIDEIITDDEKAQEIADTIAENILTVKGIKGLRKTVIIPYNTNFQPNGTIIEVSHDWENLQTSITYKESGDIPECLISQSVSSVAAFVTARENAKLNVPHYGTVNEVKSEGYISVQVGNSEVSCTTKLKNLAKDDVVLVVFPVGNKLRGQVIARL